MQGKDFRTRVGTGMYTLPVATALTTLVWMAPDVADWRRWVALLAVGLTAYQLIELNNRNTLLRVRSRMVSATFLALMAACPALHEWQPGLLAPLCLSASFIPFFRAYQKRDAAPDVFRTFLLAGLGSLFYPPLLCLLPCYWLGLLVQLRALSGRTFVASLLGAALPYWLLGVVALWRGDLTEAAAAWAGTFRTPLPDFRQLDPAQLAQGGFLVVLMLLAIVHFFRTAYNDKIRTRMFFYVFIVMDMVLLVGLFARPQDFNMLYSLLAAAGAPLVGHYFTLARGRGMNVWFCCWVVLLVALAAFSHLYAWMPSLIS